MPQIDLVEYRKSESISLSDGERDAIALALPSLSIQPVLGKSSQYHITPGSTVGAVEVGDLSVLIQPKIGIPQLLSLACYAIDKVTFRLDDFTFRENPELPDVLALALNSHARRAFAAGLLHGYRTEEETLYGVRGRIRFEDQLRRRFGMSIPVEVRYDEFTDDILANRLVKAAVMLLGGMRLRSQKARVGLGWIAAMLDNVSLVEIPAHDVPEVTFDRLNEHYRGVVSLARLILRHSAFQSNRGGVRAQGFLMDMNKVFQEFVTVALRDELGLSVDTFGERGVACLDEGKSVNLRPDLVWRYGSSPIFVGDAKYKNLTGKKVPEGDIYQLLAYVTALDLPGGLLVYAQGEADKGTYIVRNSGRRLEVDALDLSGSLDDVLDRVSVLARKVTDLRKKGRGFPPPRE